MGAMAAMLAGDGSLGVIGPIEVGDAKLYVDGFVAGATAVNPDLEVGVNYTDSFSDTALAAEAATSFIDGGATVLVGYGADDRRRDRCRQRARRAVVRHAEQPDPAGPGDRRGQPGVPLGGRPRRPRSTAIKGGDARWRVRTTSTSANEGVVIEFNADYEVPADVMSAAEATIAALASGELETGVSAAPATTTATEGIGGASRHRRPGDRGLGGASRHRRPGDDGGLTSSWRRRRGPCCCRCAASRRGSPASSPTTTSTSTFAPGRSTPCSARTAPARAR